MDTDILITLLLKPRWKLSNTSIEFIAILIKEYCGNHDAKLHICELITSRPLDSANVTYQEQSSTLILTTHISNPYQSFFQTIFIQKPHLLNSKYQYKSIPFSKITKKNIISEHKTVFAGATKASIFNSRVTHEAIPKKTVKMLSINMKKSVSSNDMDITLNSSKISKMFHQFDPNFNCLYIKIWQQKNKNFLAEYKFAEKLLYIHIIKGVKKQSSKHQTLKKNKRAQKNNYELNINYNKSFMFKLKQSFKNQYSNKLIKWIQESNVFRLVRMSNGSVELWLFEKYKNLPTIHRYKQIFDKENIDKCYEKLVLNNDDRKTQILALETIQDFIVKFVDADMYILFCTDKCYGICDGVSGQLLSFYDIATLDKSRFILSDTSKMLLMKDPNNGCRTNVFVNRDKKANRLFNCCFSDDNSKVICISSKPIAERGESAYYDSDSLWPSTIHKKYYECVWIDVNALFN